MGVITQSQYMSLIEAQRREHFDDAASVIGEAARVNQILQVLPWYPASHGTYNQFFMAGRLGKGAFSRMNGPMNVMSSSGGIVTEPVKLYDGESRVDERVLKGTKNPTAVRDSEDAMNVEGAMQDWVTALFYSSSASNPDSFDGLAARRPSLGAYAMGAGGTGSDVTSMWLAEFSKKGMYMTYPENAGGPPAFNMEDRGRHLVRTPANDGDMWAWIRHIEIWSGFTLRDERALLRYANIESTGSSNIFSGTGFIQLKNRLPSRGANAVAFANRTVLGQMEVALFEKANLQLSISEVEGFGPVMRWSGIPVLLCESLVDTETAIS